MIKIRLQRHGARHSPFYRMVVTPSTTRRDGKFIEVLGTYNPQAHQRSEELNLKLERIDHWLGVGAQPTDTAKSLIRQSRLSPEQWLEKSEREASKRLARAQKGSIAPAMEETKAEAKTDESVPVKEEEKPSEEAPAKAETKAEEKAPEAKTDESAPVKEEEKPSEEALAKAETKAEEKAAEAKSEEPAPVKEEEKPSEEAPAKVETKAEGKAEGKSDAKEKVEGKEDSVAKNQEEDSKEA